MSPPRVPQSRSAAFVRAVGAAVRARRLRLKQTSADLAQRSGLSEAAVARVEEGDPNLDLLQLVGIAEALEISVRTLLERAQRRVGWGGNVGGGGAATGAGRGGKGERRSEKGMKRESGGMERMRGKTHGKKRMRGKTHGKKRMRGKTHGKKRVGRKTEGKKRMGRKRRGQ